YLKIVTCDILSTIFKESMCVNAPKATGFPRLTWNKILIISCTYTFKLIDSTLCCISSRHSRKADSEISVASTFLRKKSYIPRTRRLFRRIYMTLSMYSNCCVCSCHPVVFSLFLWMQIFSHIVSSLDLSNYFKRHFSKIYIDFLVRIFSINWLKDATFLGIANDAIIFILCHCCCLRNVFYPARAYHLALKVIRMILCQRMKMFSATASLSEDDIPLAIRHAPYKGKDGTI
ncbi:hypothetical protein L9F63_015976, partial [Diploptera punctata]